MKQVVQKILATCNAPSLLDEALDVYVGELNVTAAGIFSVSEFHELSINFAWSQFNRNALTPPVLKMMNEGGDRDDLPAYKFLSENHPLAFYDEPQLFSVRSMEELPYSQVREYTQQLGLKMRMGAKLNQSGPWVDGLFCQARSNKEAIAFMNDERNDILLPIFSHAITIGRTLSALRSRYGEALKALDHLGIGVALVDRGGGVLDANTEANRIFDLADGLTLSQAHHLSFASQETASEYRSLITSAFCSLDGDAHASGVLMACKRTSLEHDFLLSIRPLVDAKDELESNFRCAFVTIIDPTRAAGLSSKGISLLGNLTSTETEVVDMLLQGLRPTEISARRNVSLNTTKTHLKRISEKLRCRSQSDVIRVAAVTSLPIK